MTQEEISLQLWQLITRYSDRTHSNPYAIVEAINNVLAHRGITLSSPMWSTAQLLVAKDVFRIWEGAEA